MKNTVPTDFDGLTLPISKNVGVFCGARTGKHLKHFSTAAEFGKELGKRGAGLVYGAGSTGIMGVLAESALAAGVPVTGVIPRALYEKELPNPGRSEIFVVRNMHERKELMYRLSTGFAVLPGGFGTMDEFMEVVTWSQLGFHEKPVVLVNCGNFFDLLLDFMDNMVVEGYLGSAERAIIQVASNAYEALDLLGHPRLPQHQAEVAGKVCAVDRRNR